MKKKTKNKIGKMKVASGDLLSDMLDKDEVTRELAACLTQGDKESFMEILSAYIDACKNVKQLSKKSDLSRDTLYRICKKDNVSIESVFKLLKAM